MQRARGGWLSWELAAATLLGLSWFPLVLLASMLGWTALNARRPGVRPAREEVFLAQYLAMLLLSAAVYLGAVPLASPRVRGGTYREYLIELGLFSATGPAAARALAWTVAVGLAAAGTAAVTAALHGAPVPDRAAWRHDWSYWVRHLQPPLVEETLFRGLVLALLRRRYPTGFALLWSAALFALLRVPSAGVLAAAGIGVVAGIGWGLLRLVSGSLWPSALVHYLGNTQLTAVPVLLAVLAPVWATVAAGGARRAWQERRRQRRGGPPVAAR